MAKIKNVVFDAGPFIHLSEISKIDLINLFINVFTTKEILDECKLIKNNLSKFSNIIKKSLHGKSKDFAQYLINEYNLNLGEATGIILCKQENIKLFFTDDLDAREVANKIGFEAHGTIAIILRSFRGKIITKKETAIIIENLYNNSSLFFSKNLFEWTIKEIEKFS